MQAGIERDAAAPLPASAIDFVLEGLYAQKKISRSDEFQYQVGRTAAAPDAARSADRAGDRAGYSQCRGKKTTTVTDNPNAKSKSGDQQRLRRLCDTRALGVGSWTLSDA